MIKHNNKLAEKLLSKARLAHESADQKMNDIARNFPRGYIAEKARRGKIFLYLAYTENGVKKTDYVKKAEESAVRAKVLERKQIEKEAKQLKAEAKDMEDTVLQKRYVPRTDSVRSIIAEEIETKSMTLKEEAVTGNAMECRRLSRELKELEVLLQRSRMAALRKRIPKANASDAINIFRGNLHHRIKKDPAAFVADVLDTGEISRLYSSGEVFKAVYLLSCVDTILLKLGLPLCNDYEECRALRFRERIYMAHPHDVRDAQWLPEFEKHNIFEVSIDDVY